MLAIVARTFVLFRLNAQGSAADDLRKSLREPIDLDSYEVQILRLLRLFSRIVHLGTKA
jgi:hypothetical protein